MVKKTTTLTIDSDLIVEAKKKFLNLSEIAENAIKEKIGHKEVEIDESIKVCEFCGREGEKATKDNLKGMVWLYPDEKWICERCFKSKSRSILR